MYTVLWVLMLMVGSCLFAHGLRKKQAALAGCGVAVLVATPLLFAFLSIWGELLWFESLGYGGRYAREVLARLGLSIAGALVGTLVVGWLTSELPLIKQSRWQWPAWLGALAGALCGLWGWPLLLQGWFGMRHTGIRDPILGRDVGFYLFSLPCYDLIALLLGFLLGIAILAALLDALDSEEAWRPESLFRALGLGCLLLAFAAYLAIFHLMYSHSGVVYGPGWLAVHVRLPAYYVVFAGALLAGGVLLLPPLRRWLYSWFRKRTTDEPRAVALSVGTPVVTLLGLALLCLWVIPGVVKWLVVTPNELTMERPYLANNIRFTWQAFNLTNIERQQFSKPDPFSAEMVRDNRDVLAEVRLWDPRALQAVFRQFQTFRLYYTMDHVDIDRYVIDGKYRQVMLAAREIAPENLPARSQTFVNRRFEYTHGYGLALTPVSEFEPGGLPDFLVKDIPPKWSAPVLRVDRPEIYYGEHTTGYVVVDSQQPELDYPRGEENVYMHYQGHGGVRLSSLWRKFLFGWKLGGTQLFFSTYPSRQSRILFHREIRERVQALAPFLRFDQDPYLVIADGRLYWICDGYTTSSYYPYSEPFSSWESIEAQVSTAFGSVPQNIYGRVNWYLHGQNYIRNSVKAVIDAYDGTVTLYNFDPADPVLTTWARIFPGLFHSRTEMPAALLQHIRYPQGLLLTQGLVYAKYHMTDPEVFYNQEDLWVRATELYSSHDLQPVGPYYIMWKQPGAQKLEFVQMLPFTPKGRQVLIGWLAGRCDGENYGRLIAYEFPKETRVLGPQQVEAKIDQDAKLSAIMTLWDQLHSQVLRGNLLVIPIATSLLYVEPIYLQAQAAAYPELRLVALMTGDRLGYAPTFSAALARLLAAAPGP